MAIESLPPALRPITKAVGHPSMNPFDTGVEKMPDGAEQAAAGDDDSESDASSVEVLSESNVGNVFAALISTHALATQAQTQCIVKGQFDCACCTVAAAYLGKLHELRGKVWLQLFASLRSGESLRRVVDLASDHAT